MITSTARIHHILSRLAHCKLTHCKLAPSPSEAGETPGSHPRGRLSPSGVGECALECLSLEVHTGHGPWRTLARRVGVSAAQSRTAPDMLLAPACPPQRPLWECSRRVLLSETCPCLLPACGAEAWVGGTWRTCVPLSRVSTCSHGPNSAHACFGKACELTTFS